ncbi:MAG: lysophospholipid acyltransferase family protein [Candidatus Hodarchaeales archaeon]
MKNNETVGIYPEGRRSRSGIFIPKNVKLGAAWIAKIAGRKIKVVPVFVHGTNNIIPPGKFFRLNFHARVRAYFGEPLNLDQFYDLPDSPETSKRMIRIIIQGISDQQKKCSKSLINDLI